MVDWSLKLVQSLNGRYVLLRCRAGGRDEPAAVRLDAILALDQPLRPALIEGGVRNGAVVVNMLVNVELYVEVSETA